MATLPPNPSRAAPSDAKSFVCSNEAINKVGGIVGEFVGDPVGGGVGLADGSFVGDGDAVVGASDGFGVGLNKGDSVGLTAVDMTPITVPIAAMIASSDPNPSMMVRLLLHHTGASGIGLLESEAIGALLMLLMFVEFMCEVRSLGVANK